MRAAALLGVRPLAGGPTVPLAVAPLEAQRGAAASSVTTGVPAARRAQRGAVPEAEATQLAAAHLAPEAERSAWMDAVAPPAEPLAGEA